MKRVSRILFGLSAVALVASATPASADKPAAALKKFTTTAFTISAPAHWVLEKVRVEPGGRLGKWVLRGNETKIYIRIGNMRNEEIDALFNRYVTESLRKHVRHVEMESFEAKDFQQGSLGMGHLYGVSRRKTKGHGHKYGVMVIKANDRKRVAYLAMGGTKEGWGKNAKLFHDITASLDMLK